MKTSIAPLVQLQKKLGSMDFLKSAKRLHSNVKYSRIKCCGGEFTH